MAQSLLFVESRNSKNFIISKNNLKFVEVWLTSKRTLGLTLMEWPSQTEKFLISVPDQSCCMDVSKILIRIRNRFYRSDSRNGWRASAGRDRGHVWREQRGKPDLEPCKMKFLVNKFSFIKMHIFIVCKKTFNK